MRAALCRARDCTLSNTLSAQYFSFASQRPHANLFGLLKNAFSAVVCEPHMLMQNVCGGLILFNTPWLLCDRRVGLHGPSSLTHGVPTVCPGPVRDPRHPGLPGRAGRTSIPRCPAGGDNEMLLEQTLPLAAWVRRGTKEAGRGPLRGPGRVQSKLGCSTAK